MVRQARTLTVALNGIKVADLIKLKNGGLQFIYDPAWIETPGSRPISLSLPLRSQAYLGDIPYNFFDNLLPDNEMLRTRIQQRFRVSTNHPFDLLSAIGIDCVGAIQLYAENIDPPPVGQICAEPISNAEIAKLLLAYQWSPLGMSDEQDDFRISIAGAQEKTALLFYQNQWCRPYASTPTSHILKLPIGKLQHSSIDLSDSCENEWLCLQVAKAYGLPVANCQLTRFKNVTVLVVERFDRRWSHDRSWLMRLPQEDMCQALGISPALKYESDGGPGIHDIMKVLLGSQKAIEDRETFIKSQILFWLLAAVDGHAKNFSVFLEPGGAYQMTPIYDILSAYPYIASNALSRQRVKMAMAISGKNRHYHWSKIQARHFTSTASQVGFSQDKVKQILHEMKQKTESVIEYVVKKTPKTFPQKILNPILEGLQKQALKIAD
jgi:serine/threonine-protein kinase HipA